MATQRSPNGRKWFPRIFGKLYTKHAVPRVYYILLPALFPSFSPSFLSYFSSPFLSPARINENKMAVACNCVLIAALCQVPFNILVQADVVLMCFSYVLIFLTFVVLRIRFPHTSRPFRLPAYTRYLTWIYIAIPMVIVIVQIVTAPYVASFSFLLAFVY